MKASDAIRAARALKKLKQHELAAAIGVSQQMVSEWENDCEPVAVKNWGAMKDVLGVDCAVLDMPVKTKTTSTQTTTGNRSPAQQHTGAGNQAMYERDGITCTGLDDKVKAVELLVDGIEDRTEPVPPMLTVHLHDLRSFPRSTEDPTRRTGLRSH